MTHAEQTQNLTAEQRRDLIQYAKENGRTWKSALSADWMRAAARVKGERSAYLQQVRNTLGPSWLNSVTLDEILGTNTTEQNK